MNVQKDVQLTILVRKSLSGARTERLVSASKEQKVVPTTDLSVTNIPTSAKRSLSGAEMERVVSVSKEQKAAPTMDLSVTNMEGTVAAVATAEVAEQVDTSETTALAEEADTVAAVGDESSPLFA